MRISFCKDFGQNVIRVGVPAWDPLSILFYEDFFLQGEEFYVDFCDVDSEDVFQSSFMRISFCKVKLSPSPSIVIPTFVTLSILFYEDFFLQEVVYYIRPYTIEKCPFNPLL